MSTVKLCLKDVDSNRVNTPYGAMAKKRGAKPRKKSVQASSKVMTKKQLLAKLGLQRQRASERRKVAKVKDAIKHFRTRKADRGRIILVGVSGQRDPQRKGRKGFLVYVTKTGKKQIVRYGGKEWQTAKKITDIEPPIRKNLRKAVREFQTSRRVLISKHRAVIKGKGEARGHGANDFSEAVVKKLATSIRKALTNQASQRSFLISAKVLVTLPDGSTKVYDVQVPIARPDHISIKLAGILNFVRKKFYAFMAKELAFDGFVSSGSANHIRRLVENWGMTKGNWIDKGGEPWRGAESTIVKINKIEWRIEQIK